MLLQVRKILAKAYAHPYKVLLLIGAIALLVNIAAISLPRVDNQLVGSDGIRYYMFVRSFWIDGDLDFQDEFLYFFGTEGPIVSETGMTHNQYGIGCGLLWSPFFLLAHFVAIFMNMIGIPTPLDGYSYLYQGITLIGSIVYGFLGLLLMYRIAAELYTPKAALLSTVTIWLASNILYYMIAEPSMSHAIAMFSVALFVYFGYKTREKRTVIQWGIWGLMGALILLVRLPDGPYLIVAAVESLYILLDIISRRNFKSLSVSVLWDYFFKNMAFLLCLFMGFVPQMFVWRMIYGRFFTFGYQASVESRGFDWLAPKFGKVLFSTWHGLFSWHPIQLLAIVGLVVFMTRRHRRIAVELIAAFVANLYVLSAWSIWWQAAAFGSRKFVDGSVIFVLGLTALIDYLKSRKDTLWIEATALLFIVWNALFMIQYRFGFVSLEDPLTFREMVWDKFTLPVKVIRRLLHF